MLQIQPHVIERFAADGQPHKVVADPGGARSQVSGFSSVLEVPAEGSALDTEALLGWASERLARFKLPSEFVVVDCLPVRIWNQLDCE